jgi:hypothetical protein
MVHHRSKPSRSIVIERGKRDNQTAGQAQLGGPQRQESLPVLRSLAIELGPDGAGATGDEEAVGDLTRNPAEPDRGVGTPSEIDVTGREQAPSSNANISLKSFAGRSVWHTKIGRCRPTRVRRAAIAARIGASEFLPWEDP